jgi:hypothetical protein
MHFCHIAATSYLPHINAGCGESELLLAHLVEQDESYVDHFGRNKAATVILDNAGFEMFRQNLPIFDGNKLVDLAKKVHADYLVLPDYPGEHSSKTIAAAEEFAPQFHAAGIKTFFVPQSQIGDMNDFLDCMLYAARSPHVDYIGMSILGIPNAYGVDGNPLQMFTSRYHMFQLLESMGLFKITKNSGKKIHCLGMTDGPNEIMLLERWIKNKTIDTWDSSAAFWAGVNDISFDASPTGLVNGKVKSHVDFSIKFDESKMKRIKHNIEVIDSMVTYCNGAGE